MFNYTPTELEQNLIKYICALIKSNSGLRKNTRIRVEKIIVETAKNLKLPISTLTYKYGTLTFCECNIDTSLDIEKIKGLLVVNIGEEKLEKIDDEVEFLSKIYSINHNIDEIRKTQYERYKDYLYLLILEIDNAKRNLKNNIQKFEEALLNFYIEFPNDKEFNDLGLIFNDYICVIKQQFYSKNPNLELIGRSYEILKEAFSLINGKKTAIIYNKDYKIENQITMAKIKEQTSHLKNSILELRRTIKERNLVNLKLSNTKELEIIEYIQENLKMK
jgi:hypothetical protein